jgi:hypothetical protein
MRIRIQLPKIMRIRIRNPIVCGVVCLILPYAAGIESRPVVEPRCEDDYSGAFRVLAAVQGGGRG